MRKTTFRNKVQTDLVGTGLVLRDVFEKGRGVFASRIFKRGENLLDFAGELVTLDQLPASEFDESTPTYYMQIGPNLYQGPSTTLETFTNHSCDPNCGVIIDGVNAILVAIRGIQVGEEITWDYSTTMTSDIGCISTCMCDSTICRGRIGDFKNLPKELQKKYIKHGVVPRYVIENCIKYKMKSEKKWLQGLL